MDFLNALAGLAAILLSLELLVLVFVLAAICAGIAWGLRFGEGKATEGFDKLNGYIATGRQYERMGLRMVVKPFIALHAFGMMVGVTLSELMERSRP